MRPKLKEQARPRQGLERGLRGGTYGPASRGRRLSQAELEAYAQEHGETVSPAPRVTKIRAVAELVTYPYGEYKNMQGDEKRDIRAKHRTRQCAAKLWNR